MAVDAEQILGELTSNDVLSRQHSWLIWGEGVCGSHALPNGVDPVVGLGGMGWDAGQGSVLQERAGV